MPDFAQFVALTDSDAAFDLPASDSRDDESTRSFEFDLPGLDRLRPVIIIFRVAVWLDANLQMTVNDSSEPLVDFRLIDPVAPVQPRTWLEIVDGSVFKAVENVLRVKVHRNPRPEIGPYGYMQLSDIVLLYSAVTATPLGKVNPMPQFAQYTALTESDNAFRISGGDSRNFRFALPGLDRTRTVIIMFKFAAYFHAGLQMKVNDQSVPIIDFSFYSPFIPAQPRTWHEIAPGNFFNETDNFLVVTASNEEDYAYMQVSDIIFMYHEGYSVGPVEA